MPRAIWIVTAATVALAGCGAAPASHQLNAASRTPPASRRSRHAAAHRCARQHPGQHRAPAVVAAADATAPPRLPHSPHGGPGRFPATASGVLDGKIVLVDPGHNGGNFDAAPVINRLIWNGRESETCDTTGAETDSGYTEAQFNWNVARYLTADLRAAGATVVLTRTSNTGVGPCVTERAALGNQAHASAAVSIHADGGPPGGRGFAVLEPVADGINDAIVGPSAPARHRPAERLRSWHWRAGQQLRRGGRHPAPRRPGRRQPVHCAQGVHRVCQHAQRHRRRAGHLTSLASQSRPRAIAALACHQVPHPSLNVESVHDPGAVCDRVRRAPDARRRAAGAPGAGRRLGSVRAGHPVRPAVRRRPRPRSRHRATRSAASTRILASRMCCRPRTRSSWPRRR